MIRVSGLLSSGELLVSEPGELPVPERRVPVRLQGFDRPPRNRPRPKPRHTPPSRYCSQPVRVTPPGLCFRPRSGCPRRCCRRPSLPKPSRYRAPGVRSAPPSSRCDDRAASRSSEAIPRAPVARVASRISLAEISIGQFCISVLGWQICTHDIVCSPVPQ